MIESLPQYNEHYKHVLTWARLRSNFGFRLDRRETLGIGMFAGDPHETTCLRFRVLSMPCSFTNLEAFCPILADVNVQVSSFSCL